MTDPTLEDLDGVGTSRARLLRDHGFDSVESLRDATPGRLVEIDGIGDATATDLLASAVRLLDRSEPTVSAPRPRVASPVFGRGSTRPSPRIPASPVSAADREADGPAGRAPEPEPEPGSVRETLQLAGRLVEQATAGRGRLGRTPLDPSAVRANVTVRYRASDHFDADAREVLASAGLTERRVARVVDHEAALLERLRADQSFAAGYTLDARAALADLDDPLGDRLAPLVPLPTRRRPTALAPVGLGTVRVETGDAEGGR